jgi:hypothetical protein
LSAVPYRKNYKRKSENGAAEASAGDHEGIGPSLFEGAVDPERKAAVESELRVENFVLSKHQKENADADAENGQGSGVDVIV